MHLQHLHQSKSSSTLTLVGINYRKSDTVMRSLFALDDETQQDLLRCAKTTFPECFILSTCNRTELYALTDSAEELTALLSGQALQEVDNFPDLVYVKQGAQACEHLFQVAAGLDSQILGDYEVLGQLKHAIQTARLAGTIGPYLDRLTNTVIQCAKKIKTTTALNNGTVSVAYAAVQFIKEHFTALVNLNILLIGTGKFGRQTCKYLVDYLPGSNITLVNRTFSKAQALAEAMGARALPLADLPKVLPAADVILVATHAAQPIITADLLDSDQVPALIIDLSIPNNVHPAVKSLPGITLVNVDELSRVKDETLVQRKSEVPKAMAIIGTFQDEFTDWLKHRHYVPLLKAVKTTLKELQHHHPQTAKINPDTHIQEIVNKMAVKLRTSNLQGCYYLQALNEFIA